MAGTNPADVNVQMISTGDWERYRAIRLAALGADPGAFATTAAEAAGRTDDEWRALATPSARHTLFAAVDRLTGAWIGLVGAMRSNGAEVVDLVSMWTAPEARRRGVGRALVATVIAWAGGSPVGLWVVRTNASARVLYEACGFRPDESYAAPADAPCRNELRMTRPGDGR